MPTLRVIHDRPAAGDWNMAVDEALAESVSAGGMATLRFYAWSRATLSLGYFQELSDRKQHAASARCPVVRRPSGGGAIVHDRELTYCLVLPADFPAAKQAHALYLTVHASLQAVLRNFAVTVELRKSAQIATATQFLCFQRFADGDVLCQSHKICGSAQRRHPRAIVQHGSILLATSPAAPELPGVEELTGSRIDPGLLAATWEHHLSVSLGCGFAHDSLTESERETAERSRRGKYGAAAWTAKR